MTSTALEYFTVDLRGLRAALSARAAARDGLTESDVLRSALASLAEARAARAHIREQVEQGLNRVTERRRRAFGLSCQTAIAISEFRST
jgi:hypothetical protein